MLPENAVLLFYCFSAVCWDREILSLYCGFRSDFAHELADLDFVCFLHCFLDVLCLCPFPFFISPHDEQYNHETKNHTAI